MITRPIVRMIPLLALSLILLSTLPVPLAANDSPFEGHWEGKIEIPGTPLEFDVDLSSGEDGKPVGDISIPVQGLHDLALVDVAVRDNGITFKIPGIPGDPSFSGNLSEDGGSVEGTFTQSDASFPFSMNRGAGPAERARKALEGFDGFVARAIEDWNVPGTAIAVVRGGEIVFAGGFGLRDVDEKKPMTPDTLFAVGSTTKAFTTTVLGTLVDEGKLDWDSPVREYLPRFRMADPLTTELITPRDLVTHRSGLPRHDLAWYNNTTSTREEMVARIAHLEPSETLRAKFQYNNLMYLTAGYLIERLTGETWEAAIRARILEPIGMTRTNFSVFVSQEDENFAQPYREDDDGEIEKIPFRPIDLMGPAGSINSSVNEMARWILLNLSGGRVGERQLINPGTLADIHSPHMTTGTGPERPDIVPVGYGLGWSIDTYRGHLRVSHGGGIDGFITSVVLFPNDDVGMVSFTNIGSPLPDILNRHVADLILGLDPIDWNGDGLKRRAKGREADREAEKKREATRVAGTAPSHPLADYAGDYEHPGYGELDVALDEGALRIAYNDIVAPLEHWHYDVFNGAKTEGDKTFENTKLLFRSDVNGNIAEVEATLEPRAGAIVFSKVPAAELFDPGYLSRFTGKYEMPGQVIAIELAGDVLTVSLSGAQQFTLEPDLSGRFVFKEYTLVSIEFVVDDEGNVAAANVYQPGGVYEAKKIE
jgi:CubicO group peptidase (beta-lactamase class C family)